MNHSEVEKMMKALVYRKGSEVFEMLCSSEELQKIEVVCVAENLGFSRTVHHSAQNLCSTHIEKVFGLFVDS